MSDFCKISGHEKNLYSSVFLIDKSLTYWCVFKLTSNIFQIYLRKNALKVPVAYTNQINTIRGYKNVNILLLISKAYDLKIVHIQSYFKMTHAGTNLSFNSFVLQLQ